MDSTFDNREVNHITCALKREMTREPAKGRQDPDVIFTGGHELSDADRKGLARFSLDKNYQLIHAAFGSDASRGPVAYDAVYTDGENRAVVIKDGRLWKRDRRSATILLFESTRTVLALSTKGRVILREMTGLYHEGGYALARASLTERAATRPGHMPVIGGIGGVATVVDMEAVTTALAQAA